jgi:hypothetical protein
MHNVRSTPGIAFKKARLFPNSAIDIEIPPKTGKATAPHSRYHFPILVSNIQADWQQILFAANLLQLYYTKSQHGVGYLFEACDVCAPHIVAIATLGLTIFDTAAMNAVHDIDQRLLELLGLPRDAA